MRKSFVSEIVSNKKNISTNFADTFLSEIFIYDPIKIYYGDGHNIIGKPLELLFMVIALMHKKKIDYELTPNGLERLESFEIDFQKSTLDNYGNKYIR
jgi:hypothetical protein